MGEISWGTLGALIGLLGVFSAVVLLAVKYMTDSTQNHSDANMKKLDDSFIMEFQQLNSGFSGEFKLLNESIESNNKKWESRFVNGNTHDA